LCTWAAPESTSGSLDTLASSARAERVDCLRVALPVMRAISGSAPTEITICDEDCFDSSSLMRTVSCTTYIAEAWSVPPGIRSCVIVPRYAAGIVVGPDTCDTVTVSDLFVFWFLVLGFGFGFWVLGVEFWFLGLRF